MYPLFRPCVNSHVVWHVMQERGKEEEMYNHNLEQHQRLFAQPQYLRLRERGREGEGEEEREGERERERERERREGMNVYVCLLVHVHVCIHM